ncbi:hypothetical protein GCM10020255_053650 [Rhodococcus baikonurensis]
MSLIPPVAKKVPVERTHHGHTFVDDYEWLRDKDNAEVVAYLEAENAYTDEQTAARAVAREDLPGDQVADAGNRHVGAHSHG